MNATERVQAEFDEIAHLADPGASGTDRYDTFLLSLIPTEAILVLDIGCGLGRLTWAIATGNREVMGLDLSPAMIERAQLARKSDRVSFIQGDFLEFDFDGRSFDCVVSAATLHHMADEVAVLRMVSLLRPGGRLILQDLRRDTSITDTLRAYTALAHTELARFVRTGRPLAPRRLRQAWARHGATETYLSFQEAQALADRFLPGASVVNHWMWRYTIVWDKPPAASFGRNNAFRKPLELLARRIIMRNTIVFIFLIFSPMYAALPTDSIADTVAQEVKNKAIVARVFEEIFNQGKFQVADEIYAPDFVNHGFHRDITLQEDQNAVHVEKKAFPDLKMTVNLMTAKGDLVTVVWTVRGTHTGSGFGLPPTGAKLETRGITVWRIANGRISEEWTSFNELPPYRQIATQLKWPIIGLLFAFLFVLIILERIFFKIIRIFWQRLRKQVK